MTGAGWLVAALLTVAALVVTWPVRSGRSRRRALFGGVPDGTDSVVRGSGTTSARSADAGLGDRGPAGRERLRDAARHVAGEEQGAGAGQVTRVTDGTGPAHLDGDRAGSPGGREFGTGTDVPESTPANPSIGAGELDLGGPARSGGCIGRVGAGRTGGMVGRGGRVGPRDVTPGWSTGRPPAAGPPGRRDFRRPPGARADAHQSPARRPGNLLRVAGLISTVSDRGPAPTRRNILSVGAAGAALGWLVAGPVAAVVTAGYAALGVRALLRRRAARAAHELRRTRMDQLCALAADLRAGLPVPAALTGTVGAPVEDPQGRHPAPDRVDQLVRAAVRLADRTGAPLADLVERIEADMRAMDRGLSAAAAQAAGARATAWLLAALPLGGIGLGYGIGVDPVRVLLHTPVGAACAVGATALQVGGLLWAERLGAAPEGAR